MQTAAQKHRGFTLIELLITIAVISVLATTIIVLINPLEQIAKANDSKRKNDLQHLQKALEIYYQDNQRYPPSSLGNYTIDDRAWGDPWPPYLGKLPKDPKDEQNYAYITSPDGQSYQLYTSLDRGLKDQQAREVCESGVCTGQASCGQGIECNYGVSSPNTTPTTVLQ